MIFVHANCVCDTTYCCPLEAAVLHYVNLVLDGLYLFCSLDSSSNVLPSLTKELNETFDVFTEYLYK